MGGEDFVDRTHGRLSSLFVLPIRVRSCFVYQSNVLFMKARGCVFSGSLSVWESECVDLTVGWDVGREG
jgi:hypothetical protein